MAEVSKEQAVVGLVIMGGYLVGCACSYIAGRVDEQAAWVKKFNDGEIITIENLKDGSKARLVLINENLRKLNREWKAKAQELKEHLLKED